MNYSELKKTFQELKRDHPREDLTAHIVFTEDSFDKQYPRMSRTYAVSSDNKAFWPNMGGYSIFASCLDGTDQGVRLEWYMEQEGNKGGWKVETCYILENMRDVAAIPTYQQTAQDDGTVAYFFGDTTIRAKVVLGTLNSPTKLEPVSGDQTVCGEWVDLEPDVVAGYCTLLARYFNKQVQG